MLRKHYLFILILILALILRLYRIDTLTTFGRDQGIDFLTVREMLIDQRLTLIGIKVSIADFFQGPIYLYMLLPLFWLTNLNPLAGAYTAVLVSSLTLVTLYITLLKFANTKLANLTALYFATCPPLIIFGNTPLYQNFLPLFILLTIYFLLALNFNADNTKNLFVSFLVGLATGISTELHFLSITLVIAVLLYLAFNFRTKIKYTAACLTGLLFGFSPTILFELRHNFLNSHLLISYLTSNQQVSLTQTMVVWQTKLSYLIISNNNLLVIIPLVAGIFLLSKNKVQNENYNNLRKFTLILVAVVLIFSLKLSAIEAHYFLPLLITLLLLLPIYVFCARQQKNFFYLGSLLIIVNTTIAVSQLNSNHGYFMPSGWSLNKIGQVSNIVNLDTNRHQNFNVASLLDGDTRTYPLRFVLQTQGKFPGGVAEYNSNDYLYVVARNKKEIIESKVWEINSLQPFRIEAEWKLRDNIVLYRLDRQH